jgi:hypothetical protein
MPGARRVNGSARVGLLAVLAALWGMAFGRGTVGANEVPSAKMVRPSVGHRSSLPLEVREAILHAYALLDNPRCRQIFFEFRDLSGHTLQERLEALGQTGQTYLGQMIFSESSDSAPCLLPLTLATTTPYHRVVSVCGSKFKSLARRDRQRLAVVILHEELHSLGLGENPPMSEEISRSVLEHCR